ncbi:hypothetical protein A0H81_14195, partial [Grifola frondosa]
RRAPHFPPLRLHPWDQLYSPTIDPAFAYSFAGIPASPPLSVNSMSVASDSPIPAARMLKSTSRMSPDTAEPEQQQLCLPTHQVFDFPAAVPPQPEPSPSPECPSTALPADESHPRLSISINPSAIPAKRASSSTLPSTKKVRASGERITTKDFVPPDVSGLSKREARLVKNRAAAFLSRQRKREEFENMEMSPLPFFARTRSPADDYTPRYSRGFISGPCPLPSGTAASVQFSDTVILSRVAELEQENARLVALTQRGTQQQPAQSKTHDGGREEKLLSEVEKLRAQLAAIQLREQALSEELSHKAARTAPVKTEAVEAPLRTQVSHKSEKSGASLGLMVLLCALPTLLSMPTHSSLPTTFSFPLSGSSSLPPSSASAFDMHTFLPAEYDWAFNPSAGHSMELDVDDKRRITPSPVKRLEFVDVDTEALNLGLSALDISFDARPAEDGKIRVRIHPHDVERRAGMAERVPWWDRHDADGDVDDTGRDCLADGPAFPSLAQAPSQFDFDFDLGSEYGTGRRYRHERRRPLADGGACASRSRACPRLAARVASGRSRCADASVCVCAFIRAPVYLLATAIPRCEHSWLVRLWFRPTPSEK